MKRSISIRLFGDRANAFLGWLSRNFPDKSLAVDAMLRSSMKGVEIIVRRIYRKRTIDQNRLYFAWLHIIADHMGEYDTEDVHYALKARLLGTDETPLGPVPKSSRDLETVEFTDYMEAVKAFAATEMGLSLPETDEEWEDAA